MTTHRVPQPLVLLLQTTGELLQLLGRLVDLIVGLLLLRPAFDRLVLVAQLVRIELEEIGEIFGVGLLLPAATAALLLPARDLILPERRLCALQVLKCALLRWQCVRRVPLEQKLFRRLHLLRRLRQLFCDDAERRVDRRDVAFLHPAEQRFDGFPNSPL